MPNNIGIVSEYILLERMNKELSELSDAVCANMVTSTCAAGTTELEPSCAALRRQ